MKLEPDELEDINPLPPPAIIPKSEPPTPKVKNDKKTPVFNYIKSKKIEVEPVEIKEESSHESEEIEKIN